MSDRDIHRLEDILANAMAALQQGDMTSYAIRDREFYQAIAEQSGNSALIESLARFALQIQLCGTVANASTEFAERAAHGCDEIIQALKARDAPRAACLVRCRISHTQEAILARFANETASSR
jgi:DNA-binding GntR family transcriptional regulator